uniref:Ras-GEF domain-containing protein n=1 Tax=Arcella intermedia TaxID=1963864 RepID=A0A6B2L0Y7_9EUKA
MKRILDELMLLLGGEPGCKELAGLCLEMLMKIQPHFVVSEVNHLEDSYKMVHSLVNNTFVYLVDLRDLTSLLLSYLYSMSVNGPLSQASPLKLFSVVDSISTNLVEIVHEIASARQATSYLDVQREMDFDAFRCNLQNQVDKLKTEIRMADKLFPPFSLGTPPQIFKSIIEDTGDFTITRVIIANYSSFTTFEELMASFIVGLTPPEGASMDEQDYSELKERIRKHLKYWCYFHYDDFTLQPHYLHLLEVDCLPKIGEQDPKKFINRLHKRNKSVDSAMLPDFTLQTLLDISPVISATPQQIATQISIISATLFLKISPTEFLGQSWTKLSHRHKSPNIIQFLKRTDYLSFWVATTILISGGIEKRCEAIKWFIKIAECLHGLMDFNSLMAIIVGLNNSSISRLKKSWKLVPEEELMTFHNLTKLMSPELSFKAYRACLCSVTIPCVPFLAVYLSDLTFIHEGNPDQINGQINIAKIEMIYDIINKLQQHQLLLKVGKKVEPFATYLAVLPRLNDRVLYKLSLLLEPREVPPLTRNNLSSSSPQLL